MKQRWNRREILSLLSIGGVAFSSALSGCVSAPAAQPSRSPAPGGSPQPPDPSPTTSDFFFLQLSDTHWGYKGDANPEADSTLRTAIRTINASGTKPDFVVFTGDLTQTTDDPKVRRDRMREFQAIVGELDVETRYFLPGEHDASLDAGAAYKEHFGETHYAFEHGGIRFIALDNVSDPTGSIGDAQLDWLRSTLEGIPKDAPLVVLAHRPLFDLYPAWDWATRDGARALGLLASRPNVTVFFGHIHQEHHHDADGIRHHAARSLVFPLPPPGSVPKKAPVPWDPKAPFHGLGYRSVEESLAREPQLTELPVVSA